ncbi:hypothetical protein TSOC_012758 [Tetrabaena socialis]|uniref:Peptidase M11 gametolysin domain-containing protein n=1 Tax=Tetrabaena socialis TaxID=47790 RepID=A0A2J7ZM95_9CHLO|nr:hypothetical protein TSOC_012758 [Tetrabaena socialis]|eukprot:PNH01370.1 hypothetical protein TSOC_012758 [Tetrabaena socialis]
MTDPTKPSLTSYFASASLGAVTLSSATTFVAPSVLALPCSGQGSFGRWSTSTCTDTDRTGWAEYLTQAVVTAWGVDAAKYDNIIIAIPSGTSCGGSSWGSQTCRHRGPTRCAVVAEQIPSGGWDPTRLMHELGHTMGLFHSLLAGSDNPYGDTSCIMGDGVRTCYNAAQMSLLGWAAPAANLSAADLPPGTWVTFALPAVSADPRNHVAIRPTWLAGSMGMQGTLYVSYRAPVGCDVGLRADAAGRLQVHSFVSGSWMDTGNITLLQATVDLGRIWPDPASRSVGSDSLRLAVRVLARGPLTDAVPWVRLAVCRYTVAKETSCGDLLDNDCDGLVDQQDPDCGPGIGSRSVGAAFAQG